MIRPVGRPFEAIPVTFDDSLVSWTWDSDSACGQGGTHWRAVPLHRRTYGKESPFLLELPWTNCRLVCRAKRFQTGCIVSGLATYLGNFRRDAQAVRHRN